MFKGFKKGFLDHTPSTAEPPTEPTEPPSQPSSQDTVPAAQEETEPETQSPETQTQTDAQTEGVDDYFRLPEFQGPSPYPVAKALAIAIGRRIRNVYRAAGHETIPWSHNDGIVEALICEMNDDVPILSGDPYPDEL
jgi:hypothetical protein